MNETLKSSQRNIDRKKEPDAVSINKNRLLSSVFEGKLDGGVEREYEVERRYKLLRRLSPRELMGYRSLNIEQAYVQGKDAHGELQSFRLRREWENEDDVKTFRTAYKRKEGEMEGRNEYNNSFDENDPTREEDRKAFGDLWKHSRWEPITKTRYFIDWSLPNGSTCTIHYDVHRGGKLNDYARVEIEFKSDADLAYVQGYHGYQDVLPPWIGQDVTDDKRYGSKQLSEFGPPDENEARTTKTARRAR